MAWLDDATPGNDYSLLLDDTNITVPGGDQAFYDVEGQCIQSVEGKRLVRICVFADVADPQAAAQATWEAAVANV